MPNSAYNVDRREQERRQTDRRSTQSSECNRRAKMRPHEVERRCEIDRRVLELRRIFD